MKTWFNDKEQSFLFYLLLVLFTTFVAVMFSETVENSIGQLVGISGKKNAILTFLGFSMGGVLLVLQTIIANTRAEAMEKAALEQAKANKNTEKGQRQERLKNAIEHLGREAVSLRLGGAYELFHLAQDTEDLRQTVLDILCAHIRQTTSESEYREIYNSKPSEEIQSLLTLLFVQNHDVFKNCNINLQGSWFNGVNLLGARLEKAVLIKAHLHEVNLFEADLREADLEGAYLYGTNLVGANLQKADLEEADLRQVDLINTRLQGAYLAKARLQDANVSGAWLQGADLCKAHLQGANLFGAQLQGTDFFDTRLQKANLISAKLHGANLGFAQLQCAELNLAQLQGANLCEAKFQEAQLLGAQFQGVTSQSDGSSSFETRIKDRIGEMSDLSGVTFTGGLKWEDVESLSEGLSSAATSGFLENHIDKPESYELPKDSGVITGAYTKEEAEQWIEEYNNAMSEVPKENDS